LNEEIGQMGQVRSVTVYKRDHLGMLLKLVIKVSDNIQKEVVTTGSSITKYFTFRFRVCKKVSFVAATLKSSSQYIILSV